MKIELLEDKDIDALYEMIVDSIRVSYSSYYPEEAIAHFIEYSNKEGILKDSRENYVIVAKDNGRIVGTGTLIYTHIQRVFVHPSFQGTGVGKGIMANLEAKARQNNLPLVELHSSLFAYRFYVSLGYKLFKIGKVHVQNGEILYYQRMTKNLGETESEVEFNFHKKLFKVVKNDGVDVEVNTDTVFSFYQNGDLLYAKYQGGKVKYGEIFGVIANDRVKFYYRQENLEGGKNLGKSTDEIRLIDGKIQLTDRWQWENKKGEGECILLET